MNRRHAEVPETLNQVLQQMDITTSGSYCAALFIQWRATQPVRTKLPEAFWQSAAQMARQHGLNLTAKTLRLDYTALKQVLFALEQRTSRGTGTPAEADQKADVWTRWILTHSNQASATTPSTGAAESLSPIRFAGEPFLRWC